ncbi:MAG: tRNA pseudouridine(38-40) synthase TruA [Gammaproteobacteria bacterium]|nr:tRNA pseudouridine(38-40) synthase TruA [Gammaproteobacteria bacterium]
MRIAVGVEYKGTAFSGWQSQTGVRTVQDCVEQALSRVADHPVRVVTAGRTDAGVHATGQVVHFDTGSARPGYSWLRGANSHLPADVRILWTRPVPETFHARFRAVERAYRYVLYSDVSRPAILGGLCTWVYPDLDVRPMQEAASSLLGRHDFSAFRAAGCQAKSPWRTIRRVALSQSGPWLWLDIAADAFLQHMVRNIVGALIPVGRGERPPEWPGQVLEGADRTRAGVTAPPEGLYLTAVRYSEEFALPAPAPPVRFW